MKFLKEMFTFNEDVTENKNIIFLTIAGDYNDGDYVKEDYSFRIDNEDDMDMLKLLNKVLKCKRCNWENAKEELTSDEVESLWDYIPGAPDADEVHSIEFNNIIYYDENGKKFNGRLNNKYN